MVFKIMELWKWKNDLSVWQVLQAKHIKPAFLDSTADVLQNQEPQSWSITYNPPVNAHLLQ